MSQEDRVPERLRQRRVESALPRPSDSYNNKLPEDYNPWKNKSDKTKIKAPNSEKNNPKHFHFQGSPSLNNSILDGQDDRRNQYKKIYLNPKPNTSGGMNRSYVKKERIGIPNRITNLKNTFAFNSVGHYSTNLNDSGLGFEDSVQHDKFEITLSNYKAESNSILRHNDLDSLLLNQGDSSVQKLREELKRLQVNF